MSFLNYAVLFFQEQEHFSPEADRIELQEFLVHLFFVELSVVVSMCDVELESLECSEAEVELVELVSELVEFLHLLFFFVNLDFHSQL